MHRATVHDTVLADRLRVADTHWTRLRGLLGTRRLAPGEGLWIRPCNQVHMFGMRYPIDVVFLDDAGLVLRTVENLRPWRVSPRVRGAASVLELPAGAIARAGIADGATVTVGGDVTPARAARGEGLRAAMTNVAVALLFALFAAAHVSKAMTTGVWITTMPLVVQEALLVVLFLTRRRSTATSTRPFDWAVAIAGTLLPLCLRPGDTPGDLAWLGEPLQFLGVAAAALALASLGRSVGVVAANRGIKTSGLYRLVRHPAYAGYLLGYAGYLLCHPTPMNALLVAGTLGALIARAVVEENLLARDAGYRDYLQHTPWRFVPYVY
jgi:protein-S-isoprenylcysteine O-methyltransferase Ste14/uncharacterized membrane protein (UPF0127 family)